MKKQIPSKTVLNNMSYGFQGRLCEVFPSQIIVDITERCNLACIHCPHSEFKNSKNYSGCHLSPELNSKMIEEIRQHGQGRTKYIRYSSNGEPLLHPNAHDMIREAVSYSGVHVTLTTNGTIMNESATQKLLEADLHSIDISIDAFHPETYKKIRLNGNLEITAKNVLRLIRWVREAKAKTKIVVSFIEQPLNHKEKKDFELYWKDMGADYIVIRRMHSCSGAKKNLILPQKRPLIRRPCLYPWERIVLTAKGFLAFCPADWGHQASMIEYSSTSIADCWQGPFYKKLRTAHLENDFHGFKFCRQCPDWSATRWPGEGLSYADMVETFIESKDFGE